MPLIKILPAGVASKIAAGEVVERPVSVVKELVENALDAGATEIRVDLLNGGKKLIRIQDNGRGMSQEDAALCFKRHATSKISEEEDLERISTFGFRGEALASISAVSRVVLKTSDGSGAGYLVEREGEKLLRFSESAFPKGTLVEVQDLFFNLPARRKFLRSERSELSLVVNYLTGQALAFPEIKFVLTNNQKEIINCPAVSSLRERIYQIFGRKVLDKLMPLEYEEDRYVIYGLSSRPFAGRLDRQHQLFYVNRRPVKDRMLTAALTQAYLGLLEKGKYPEGFILLSIPFNQVDVNVHPAKSEVRFREPQKVFRLILKAVEMGARSESLVKTIIVAREEVSGREGTEWAKTEADQSELVWSVQEEELPAPVQAEVASHYGLTAAQKKMQAKRESETAGKSFRVLGQYLNSYIVAVSDEAVFIIDQHNAHERILFEKFLELGRTTGWNSKQPLFPQVLELSPAQKLSYEEMKYELEELGFGLEPMGGNSLVLREYPEILSDEEVREVFFALIEDSEDFRLKDRMERLLATMACKTAVKAGQPLQQEEMEFLVRELFNSEQPGLCPHGRPVVIRLERSRIERILGRKPDED